DLNDDCMAYYKGLCLRAEAMDQDADGKGTDWWWDVTERSNGEVITYASSNGDGVLDSGEPASKATGQEARDAAEE
ncbi:MAG: hypothetical protein GTO63_23155, partial [Anaerolineae bacterium]|nr:hypothetical protein [Anaerolineae bacterium]NIN97650.1 hypothetical protein [Anaerolineae bacterium]NIQ80631.1 hypothetical protein [Anaerolineae bacterium]